MNKDINTQQAICEAIQAAADLSNYVCRALNLAYSNPEEIYEAQERVFCPALDEIRAGLSDLLVELAGKSADCRIPCAPAITQARSLAAES